MNQWCYGALTSIVNPFLSLAYPSRAPWVAELSTLCKICLQDPGKEGKALC